MHQRGLGIVATPVEMPTPMKPAAYDTISAAAFAAAAQEAGGDALWLPPAETESTKGATPEPAPAMAGIEAV